VTESEQRNRSRSFRDIIFWVGTALSVVASVLLPMLGVGSTESLIAVFVSWTLSTVLSLYVGQRLFESEQELRYESLIAAINDNCATDRLKETLKDIRDKRPGLFHDIAQSHMGLLQGQLQSAMIGVLELDERDRLAVALKLASEVKLSLDATTFFEDDPTVSEYHELLAEAIADPKRHVTVRRLFLIKSGMENSIEFEKRIRKDIGAKVDVRCRPIDDWIGSPGVPQPVIFGIWDKDLVWFDPDGSGRNIAGMRPRLLHGDVGRFQKVFDQNWNKAATPPVEWFPQPKYSESSDHGY
jgi:hypothetical protein